MEAINCSSLGRTANDRAIANGTIGLVGEIFGDVRGVVQKLRARRSLRGLQEPIV